MTSKIHAQPACSGKTRQGLTLALRVLLGCSPLLSAYSSPSNAQEIRRLPVDLNDPAIAGFKSGRPRIELAQPAFPRLEIPVLNLVKSPLLGVETAWAKGECRHALSTDADKGWYAVQHTCPELVILITADRRVQSASAEPLPDHYRQATIIEPASGDVHADNGFTASIVTRRFPNIPYHISVECTDVSKSLCMSEPALRALLEKIALVSVPAQ